MVINKSLQKLIIRHKIIWLILIWSLSFYVLSVKFWQGDNEVSYWVFTIDILRWFSVWATVIALLWSLSNLFIINSKFNDNCITNYNFRIFSVVYNLMSGIIFWCGIFKYGWNDYIVVRAANPLSFSYCLIGHLIIPILLISYAMIYSDYYVISHIYYKKYFFWY